MSKRLIYLQSSFWKKIRSSDNVEERRLFWDLYGALECCNIKSDIPKTEWNEDKDDLLYYLLQNSADGYGTRIINCSVETIQGALDSKKEQPIENLCAIYLLEADTQTCKGYSSQLGVLCLNAEMIKDYSFVRGSSIMFEKGEAYDRFEKCKKQLASPCNSMILIDPYILFNKWNIELNLIPLLDKCLPPDPIKGEDQNIEFHLSIFSQTNECFIGKYKDKLRYEDIYKFVYAEIRKKRPKLKMKFSLYHINTTGNGDGDFHSRHILTNCMLINSEDGFDFFENKKNVYTNRWEAFSGKHVRIEFLYPTLMDERRLDAANYFRWLRLSKSNTINNPLCWGDKNNRLFSFVE